MAIKSCVICSVEFNATAKHKTCGATCSKILTTNRLANRFQPKYRACCICGTEFRLKTSGTELTCSSECSKERCRQTTRKRKRKCKPAHESFCHCVICGNSIPICGSTKTCAGACRDALRKQTQRKYQRNSEKQKEHYRKWIQDPVNKEKTRASKRRYAERYRASPERIAKRREWERKRREQNKRRDERIRRAEAAKYSRQRQKRRSEMTAEELTVYRKQQAEKMRKYVANPSVRARVNKTKAECRKRKNRESLAASVLLAAQKLSESIKGNTQ